MRETDPLRQSAREEALRDASESSVRRSGLTLGRPFGIPLVADPSLLIIFGLVVLNLGAGVFPSWHPDWQPWLSWLLALCAALAFLASVAAHELCHALVARARGMRVRRIQLFVFGGMAQIEGEPPSAKVEFWMAIVGPIASLIIGALSAWAGSALLFGHADAAQLIEEPSAVWQRAAPLPTLLLWLGPVNLFLGLFNLVPGFPLDGGRVLRSIVWWTTGDLRKATRVAALAGQFFAWLLMGTGVFMLFGYVFPWLGGGLAQGLWLLLIGWFLNNAARMSFQQLVVQQTLSDVAVREVMRSRVDTVEPSLTLAELVRQHLMNTEQSSFPVVHEGTMVGIIRAEDVRSVPRDQRSVVRVGDAMVPLEKLHVVDPDGPALDALRYLADSDTVPVVDHGRFVGVTRRDDVIRWLALHTAHPI